MFTDHTYDRGLISIVYKEFKIKPNTKIQNNLNNKLANKSKIQSLNDEVSTSPQKRGLK